MLLRLILGSLISVLFSAIIITPYLVRTVGRFIGWRLRQSTQSRRILILRRVKAEEYAYARREPKPFKKKEGGDEKDMVDTASYGGVLEREWNGIIGFFHPFCNAGGGGERVLWAAIQATQKRWPKAICVVYTGDQNVDKGTMLSRVQSRFNIQLHPPTIVFLYISTRYYVLSSTYPHFTLLGQSLGSLILAMDAFGLLTPDIFIDTMGYSFTLALCKLLFPLVPTGAYVHYPTISTDMLDSLSEGGKGVHVGRGTGIRGFLKKRYWRLFARLYGWVGKHADVVMVNSSWTQGHIRSLWGRRRRHLRGVGPGVVVTDDVVDILNPPVAVKQLEEQIEVSLESEKQRENILLYIAQFRPEKNHAMIMRAFATLLRESESQSGLANGGFPRLVLIGSIRNSDDAKRVYELRLLAHELKIKEDVEFVCDASWPEILVWLRRSWIGLNGMWNEHFGIGVVEYQAAGLICVVHDSGGPKYDIVIDIDGGPTGFHATTDSEYAAAFQKVFSMPLNETVAMRRRAQTSARRFSEEVFARGWIAHVDRLVELARFH